MQLEMSREEILQNCCWTFTGRFFGVHGDVSGWKRLVMRLCVWKHSPAVYPTKQPVLSGTKQETR